MPCVFIVDDQLMNRELLQAYLEDSGHRLVHAESGEEALSLAQRDPPDLVLLDVMMPGIGGFQTAQRLKEQARGTFLPILLLTSLSDHASRLRGLQSGADEFLTKPIDRSELAIRVRNLLALRAQEELLRAQKLALEEASRFKDEMTSMLVHDLKSPMAVILGNLELMRMDKAVESPDAVDAIVDCQSAGLRIVRMVSNLLDLEKLESNRLEARRAEIDVAALLRNVARPMRAAAREKGIHIVERSEAGATLWGDADLLTRVIENILDNSLQYTPAGGWILLQASRTGGEVEIRIGNSGPAIPPAARRVVFEKFGQVGTSPRRTNLGLGLYFCRLAAEAHGGTIGVEETPELPTMFSLRLPVARQPEAS